MWTNEILFIRVLRFRFDKAYLTDAYATLHELFHITCVVHGLNRVAEKVKSLFPDVNVLIAFVKAVVCKARERTRTFSVMLRMLHYLLSQ